MWAITKILGKYTQVSYTTMVCVIQLEWICLKCTKKETGYAFIGVENLLPENVLPRLFFGKSKYFPPIVGTLNTMLVKKSGLGVQDPVT